MATINNIIAKDTLTQLGWHIIDSHSAVSDYFVCLAPAAETTISYVFI